MEKICNSCNQKLDSSEFSFRKYKKTGKIGLNHLCKRCYREYNKERQKRKRVSLENRNKEREYSLQKRIKNPELEMLNRTRKRAFAKNIPFNLEISDIVIPERCPILDIPLKLNTVSAKDDSPSLDKIDSSKGYIKGNVRVISRLANIMKAHATKEQIEKFCQNIKSYLSPE